MTGYTNQEHLVTLESEVLKRGNLIRNFLRETAREIGTQKALDSIFIKH